MKSYKIYYINLDKSILRKEFMESQFKTFNVPFERFSAIYGKNLPKDFILNAKKQHQIIKHFPFLNEGEIGLIKSYFELWSLISKQKEDYAIVFEDDALIREDFFNDLDTLLSQITMDDFVDISGNKGLYRTKTSSMTDLYIVPPLRTTGQIIGKSAAIKLEESILNYEAPIDVMLQEVYKHNVKVFCTKTAYVLSNDKNVGGTTIQKKNMLKIKKIVREIIRPIWQLASFLTYKSARLFKNYSFYTKNN